MLRKHAASIAALQARPELQPLLDARVHDEIWLLRYVLSAKGDLDKATKNVRRAIEWRRENARLISREQLAALAADDWRTTGTLPFATASGQPVQVAAPFLVNLDARPEQFHFDLGIANRERAYQAIDRLTRETGRLTKLVIVQDLRGFSVPAVMRYMKYAKIQGALSKLSEALYPQLVAVVVVVHPPAILDWAHGLVRPLLSPKLLEKVRIASSEADVGRTTGLAPQQTPTFLGGSYVWEEMRDWE
jgi:hypothetical protein